MADKVRLNGGPEETVSWIWLDPPARGQLKVEFYDFSELAQRMFGNDIAYLLTVDDMSRLLLVAGQDETSLIPWVSENFKSYFEIKRWLEDKEVAFSLEIDSWA